MCCGQLLRRQGVRNVYSHPSFARRRGDIPPLPSPRACSQLATDAAQTTQTARSITVAGSTAA
jgi:hypothetical protein